MNLTKGNIFLERANIFRGETPLRYQLKLLKLLNRIG